jgi:squalene-hopene/tetraprenyl-beta-curcumene cyclase
MGLQGLYYYFHTLSKALNAHGSDVIVDAGGARHRWREDLIAKLASLQKADGFWQNEVARWWENNPDLVTSYCVLALEEALGVGVTAVHPRRVARGSN